eukprot:CAMPEP_0167745340 /NCGR_PEP_ID=MMETSP0110_2-20121227/3098_1 /TAXON_ID=629695 /ORGANISM="Gymnochlora sp., Strain CCMP2014" /LENGTH=60 /DNA_ID=CAMNT_0007629973 /DNA_START=663 /DNA_END=845 /DNA_ORIENTATION=+
MRNIPSEESVGYIISPTSWIEFNPFGTRYEVVMPHNQIEQPDVDDATVGSSEGEAPDDDD